MKQIEESEKLSQKKPSLHGNLVLEDLVEPEQEISLGKPLLVGSSVVQSIEDPFVFIILGDLGYLMTRNQTVIVIKVFFFFVATV